MLSAYRGIVFSTFAPMLDLSFGLLVHRLSEALEGPLPGWKAQSKMTSRDRIRRKDHIEIPDGSKQAGVLLLLFPMMNDVGLVLMRRAEYNGVHSGQISFPGGKREKSDFSLEDTAIRETNEEIGVEGEDITCIGKLTDLYIPPSNFHVTPVVGYVVNEPRYIPDPEEVAEVLEIKISDLLEDTNYTMKEIRVNEHSIMAPAFEIDNHTIWGATAMILSEFIDVIRRALTTNGR
jgi:8-oxo-dGTP pyrophosphatase MutT (NUDIX family)